MSLECQGISAEWSHGGGEEKKIVDVEGVGTSVTVTLTQNILLSLNCSEVDWIYPHQ